MAEAPATGSGREANNGNHSALLDLEAEGADELTSLPSLQVEQPAEEIGENLNQQPAGELVSCDKQFNRLDPNRRSFSSPTVNLLQLAGRQQVRTAAVSFDEEQEEKVLLSRNRDSVETTTSSQQRNQAFFEKRRRVSKKSAGSENKQRRQTTLGLISFGSAHFRLVAGSGGQTGSGSQQQQQGGAGSGASKPSNNWRSWFARQLPELRQQNNATSQNQISQKDPQIKEETARKDADGQSSAEVRQLECHSAGTRAGVVERSRSQQEISSSVATGSDQRPGKGSANVETEQVGAIKSDKKMASKLESEFERTGSWSLLERLIDSQLEWRQVICEANGGESALESLSQLQIKRQEVIHELVQTERHHCLTLALMRQVYQNGLKRLNDFRCEQHSQSHKHPVSGALTQPAGEPAPDLIDLERLFPALEELIQAHELFFAHLRLRLVESCQIKAQKSLLGLVGRLGELLHEQFRLSDKPKESEKQQLPETETAQQRTSGKANGHKLLAAYAKFCGQHNDSSRYYKHLMQSDKAFKQFIEQCNKLHPACRQRGIPECNLLVTQRLTKYPLLIDQLIKTSKDDAEEERQLRLALAECKALLAELNNQLARKESFERLLGIYAQFSPKSYTIYNKHLKFTKHDLLQHKRLRQLLHSDGQLRVWSANRRKLLQVLCLILNDIIVFLRVEAPANSLEHPHEPTSGSHINSNEPPATGSGPEPLPLPAESSLELQAAQQSALINNAVLAQGTSGGAGQPTGSGSGSGASSSGFSVRYYFANIDQKSSVISLSKLLIREKAVNDGDGPRIYLISSSPRQPEMYELAFVSKRHQTSFVEKLKACVEQHTKSLLEGDAEDAINEEELLYSEQLPATCCPFHENSRAARSSSSRSSSRSGSGSDSGSSEEDEEDAALSRRRQSSAGDFELDIEQDVIIPSCSELEACQQPEVGENQPGESSDQLISNESGLSERARDSLDESSGRKVRINQRRRRTHRPRNVSNQSSSSSEAAHRQAIQLIQGNLANSSTTETTTTTTTDSTSKPEVQPKATQNASEEEFDSGRGQDDCSSSSAASISSSSLGVEPESKSSLGVQNEKKDNTGSSEKQEQETTVKTTSSASSTTSSRFSSSDSAKISQEATGSGTQNRISNLVKCSSVLSKSACNIKQQRKLSTVSTMSSQLKLLSKFKSVGGCSNSQQANQHRYEQLTCNHCDNGSPLNSPATTGNNNNNNIPLFSKQARQLMRRSTFIPEQKLEELRDLRIQLDKDKQEWQAKFNKMQEQLLNERRELDLAREKLKQDKQQVANERDQLYRKLDLLKEKGILLSPSHKVIITSPDAATMMYQQQLQQQQFHNYEPTSQIQLINVTSNNQRQQPPLQIGYQSTSSIRINNQQTQNLLDHNRQATNLFIQQQNPHSPQTNSLPVKVPLHLSEQGSGQTGNGSNPLTTAQRVVSSSFGLNKFPPLMQVFGGSIGLINSNSNDSTKQLTNHHHLESHLI